MGRISLYEQSKLPSAVSGYRTSAAPEVAALENVSQSISSFGRAYETRVAADDGLAQIEAQNAFNDYAHEYNTVTGSYDRQAKTDKSSSAGIDELAKKRISAMGTLKTKYGTGLSDAASKYYDAAASGFLSREEINIKAWAEEKKFEVADRDNSAGLAAYATTASEVEDPVQFQKMLGSIAEGAKKAEKVFGRKRGETYKTVSKLAVTQHIANRMANDPKSLARDLETGAYADVVAVQSKLPQLLNQATIAAKEQELNSAFVGNLQLANARDALQKSISDGSFDRSAVLAEYSFAEDGSPEKKMLGDILNRPQVMGGLQKATPEARKLAGTTLMTELSAIGLQKNASKLERVVAYNALSEKAELMLSSGAIDSDTYSSIAKVANSLNAGKRKKYAQNLAKIGQDKTAFKSMHANEDDPLEYVLYRGFDDIGKATKDTSNMGTVREKYMQQVVRAFEAKYGDDDDYASIKQKMKDPAFRDQLYTSIARATAGKDGNAVGFDALRRAYSDATGKAYVNTYLAKDGKQHKIVASLGATTYIEMSKDMLQSLDRKEK